MTEEKIEEVKEVETSSEETATENVEQPQESKLKQRRKKFRARLRSGWADFKSFINKGNALDLAIGVVIGTAFTAIVTAFSNVLLSFCTWGVPGGLSGLVTILPAANSAQAGLEGVGQFFDSTNLYSLSYIYAEIEAIDFDTALDTIKESYTLYGTTYVYNGASVIDWGSIITALISFIIIAIVLFVILRVATSVSKRRKAYLEKIKEAYYKKHPDERPVKVPEEVQPTELEVLLQIKDLLAKQQGISETTTDDKKPSN